MLPPTSRQMPHLDKGFFCKAATSKEPTMDSAKRSICERFTKGEQLTAVINRSPFTVKEEALINEPLMAAEMPK